MKRIAAASLIALLAAPLAATAQTPSPSDLVGSWNCVMPLDAGDVTRSVAYAGDGSYEATSVISVTVGAEFLTLEFFDTGVYNVEDGALVYTTSSIETTDMSASPAFEPQAPLLAQDAESRVGNTVTQQIVAFDGSAMRLSDGVGQDITCTR